MRVLPVLVSLAVLLAALSACGQDADPQPPPADPPAAARTQAAWQASTPTPAPPTAAPSPSLSPLPAAFSPGDRSDGSQGPYEAPAFSLATGFGPRVTLGELLEDHDAVVLVFYRGFF